MGKVGTEATLLNIYDKVKNIEAYTDILANGWTTHDWAALKTLVKDGVQLGVSTRGVGSLKEQNGQTLVESDYTISAIDVVSNPSGIDCWVDGILENVEYYYDKGVLCECTAEEFLLHKKNGSIIQIEEDFKRFLTDLVL